MLKYFSFLVVVCLAVACNNPQNTTQENNTTTESNNTTEQTTTTPPPAEPAYPFTQSLEEAHHKADFLSHEAIQFDLVLEFGGKERFRGTITTTTNSLQGCLAMENGNKIYYDGDVVRYSPALEKPGSVRFAAYTWPYFFLFPYKLSDPGTQWQPYADGELNGTTYEPHQLTFKAGVGDDPEDWYIVYANPQQQLIDVAAYIVTAGSSREEAEKDPHAISYHAYQEVEGVPIATHWTFWSWRKEGGLTEELGKASLSNIKFVNPDADFFKAPEDFKTT